MVIEGGEKIFLKKKKKKRLWKEKERGREGRVTIYKSVTVVVKFFKNKTMKTIFLRKQKNK